MLTRIVKTEAGDPDSAGNTAVVDDVPSGGPDHRPDFILHCGGYTPDIDIEHSPIIVFSDLRQGLPNSTPALLNAKSSRPKPRNRRFNQGTDVGFINNVGTKEPRGSSDCFNL